MASPTFGDMLHTTIRILTFRASREELLALGGGHLAFGLLCAWIVGVGRFWDNPRVGLLPHLGLGSVAYVFVLSAFLWLLTAPLRPADWSFFRLLTFVSLASPPAIVYALPFQFWLSMPAANAANTALLALVATWRLALLFWFLRRAGCLSLLATVVGGIFPMVFLVAALGTLNLDRAVFDFMRGVQDVTPNDRAYAFLVDLMMLAYLAFIPTLIGWVIVVGISTRKAWTHRRNSDRRDEP